METQNKENEKKEVAASIRKIQESLHKALQEKQYWGLDQKISILQRNILLSQRI